MSSAERPGAPEGPAPTSYYFKTDSSLYAGVLRRLEASKRWRRCQRPEGAPLQLLERWQVPWARLAERARASGQPLAVNHVRGSKCVTIKALMVKALREHTGEPQPALLPETHLVVPGGGLGDERAALLASPDADSRWIAKPTAGAHGDGIRVFACAAEALAYVDSCKPAADEMLPPLADASGKPLRRPLRPRPAPAWLVQRYVDRPMLYRGRRKFDVRAIVGVRHDGAAFLYSEYVARVCGSAYDLANLDDKFAHITNHCVQVESDSYGQQEEGNEVFSADVEAYLCETRGEDEGRHLHGLFMEGMMGAARVLVAAMAERTGHGVEDGSPLDANEGEGRLMAFQLIGLDIIADEDGRVLLLEANGSPACAERMVPGVARAVETTLLAPLLAAFAERGGVGSGADDGLAADLEEEKGEPEHTFLPL